ncbi:hypothetical protein CBF23_008435 [Marinomonas agarivorans]|nr:hypothetical protein CBF23_008435 [Marinomonas agarivorans]
MLPYLHNLLINRIFKSQSKRLLFLIGALWLASYFLPIYSVEEATRVNEKVFFLSLADMPLTQSIFYFLPLTIWFASLYKPVMAKITSVFVCGFFCSLLCVRLGVALFDPKSGDFMLNSLYPELLFEYAWLGLFLSLGVMLKVSFRSRA